MQAKELLQELLRLPVNERIYMVDEAIKSINKEKAQHQMENAVLELYEEYIGNKELTAFSSLDLEDFYEPK